MAMLLTLHGNLRWLVAAVALVVAVRSLAGWLRRGGHTGLDRGLIAAYAGLLDLNFVLGLVLLFGLAGGLAPHRVEHAVTMTLAIAVAHATAAWRRSEDPVLKHRNNFIAIAISAALVAVAVVRLRGSW